MSTLPDPLTPFGCDLSGYDWFPLHFRRLRQSRWWRTASDFARSRNVDLWGAAYESVPAGSLPNDDVDLADIAGFGRDLEGFRAVKAELMAAWTLCSDDRFYHPTLCEVALEAWSRLSDKRKKERVRKAEQRAKVRGATRPVPPNKGGGPTGQSGVSHGTEALVPRDCATQTGEERTGQSEASASCAPSARELFVEPVPSRVKGRSIRPTEAELSAFEAFWNVYPARKDRKRALETFVRTLRAGADLSAIMRGAEAYAREQAAPNAPRPKYAQGWLNDQRWTDEPAAPSAQVIPLTTGRRGEWSALQAGIDGLDFEGEHDERRG